MKQAGNNGFEDSNMRQKSMGDSERSAMRNQSTGDRVISILSCLPFFCVVFLIISGIIWQHGGRRLYRRLSGDLTVTQVSRVVDRDKLVKVVLRASDSQARKAAFDKLTGRALSPQIAAEDHIDLARASAAENLIDQRLWAKLALEAKDWEIRKSAVDVISDQVLLGKVAANDDSWEVRKASIEKIADQAILSDSGQALLENVALNDRSWMVREVLTERITNQTVLQNIALNDDNAGIRQAAILKLDDKDLLAEIAERIAIYDKSPLVRGACVEKMADQTILSRVAVNDKEAWIRKAAVVKLNDKDLLAKIAVEDADQHVREVALICSGLTFEPGVFDRYLDEYPAIKSELKSWEDQASINIKIQIKRMRTSADPVTKLEAAMAVDRYETEEAKGAILALMNTLYDHTPLGLVEYMPKTRIRRFPNMPVTPSTDPASKAARALAAIGEAAVKPLIVALHESDDRVCEKAIEALGMIGDTRAVEPLLEVMNRYSARRRTEYLYIDAITALGEIGNIRAIEALEEAKNSESEKVRSAAIAAVDKIKEHAGE